MTTSMTSIFAVAAMLQEEYRVESFIGEKCLRFNMFLGFRVRSCYIEVEEDEPVVMGISLGLIPSMYEKLLELFFLDEEFQDDSFQVDTDSTLYWFGKSNKDELIKGVDWLIAMAEFELCKADGIIQHMLANTDEDYLLEHFKTLTMRPLGGIH